MLDVSGVDVQVKLVDHVFQQHDAPCLMVHKRIVCGYCIRLYPREKVMVKHVRVRAMSKVVAQACNLNQAGGVVEVALVVVAPGGQCIALVVIQAGHEGAREVRDADGVLEAVVRRAGEDEVGAAQLFEVAQALDVRGV